MPDGDPDEGGDGVAQGAAEDGRDDQGLPTSTRPTTPAPDRRPQHIMDRDTDPTLTQFIEYGQMVASMADHSTSERKLEACGYKPRAVAEAGVLSVLRR